MNWNSEIAALTETVVTHSELTRAMSTELIHLRQLIYLMLLCVGLLFSMCVALSWVYIEDRVEAAEESAAMLEDLQLRVDDLKETCNVHTTSE